MLLTMADPERVFCAMATANIPATVSLSTYGGKAASPRLLHEGTVRRTEYFGATASTASPSRPACRGGADCPFL